MLFKNADDTIEESVDEGVFSSEINKDESAVDMGETLKMAPKLEPKKEHVTMVELPKPVVNMTTPTNSPRIAAIVENGEPDTFYRKAFRRVRTFMTSFLDVGSSDDEHDCEGADVTAVDDGEASGIGIKTDVKTEVEHDVKNDSKIKEKIELSIKKNAKKGERKSESAKKKVSAKKMKSAKKEMKTRQKESVTIIKEAETVAAAAAAAADVKEEIAEKENETIVDKKTVKEDINDDDKGSSSSSTLIEEGFERDSLEDVAVYQVTLY